MSTVAAVGQSSLHGRLLVCSFVALQRSIRSVDKKTEPRDLILIILYGKKVEMLTKSKRLRTKSTRSKKDDFYFIFLFQELGSAKNLLIFFFFYWPSLLEMYLLHQLQRNQYHTIKGPMCNLKGSVDIK